MTRPSVDMTKLCGYLGTKTKRPRVKKKIIEDNSNEALRVRMIGKVTMAR